MEKRSASSVATKPRISEPEALMTNVPQGKVAWGSRVCTQVPTTSRAIAPRAPPRAISR